MQFIYNILQYIVSTFTPGLKSRVRGARAAWHVGKYVPHSSPVHTVNHLLDFHKFCTLCRYLGPGACSRAPSASEPARARAPSASEPARAPSASVFRCFMF